MRTNGSAGRRHASGGFSLFELLLVASLLIMFLGAAVYTLKPSQGGVRLQDGALRFEGMLRLARAEAANSGKRVRVAFSRDEEPATNQFSQVKLTWEPDPVEGPDVFEDLPRYRWDVERLNETIGIKSVSRIDEWLDEGVSDGVAAAEDSLAGEENRGIEAPPITFNPDGSSDSAEVVLAARDSDETRRVTVRIVGLTGTISSVWQSEEAAMWTAEEAAASAEAVPVASE